MAFIEKLTNIANGFRTSRSLTEKLSLDDMAVLAAVPITSGENKLAQFVDGTITEITAEDLEGATEIGQYGFYRRLNLKTVIFAETIKNISIYAFQSCTELTNVIVSSNLETIGSYAFSTCTKLTSINFPASVKTINNYAFENTGFTSVIIPNTLTRISDGAFTGCKKLETAIIGSGITEIDDRTFQNCSSLRDVRLSEGLTLIRHMSFGGCTSLTNLTIPASVTKIEGSALDMGSSSNKATITFLSPTPCIITISSFNTNYLEKIIVPAGSGEAYKTATNWANFADYIEEAIE